MTAPFPGRTLPDALADVRELPAETGSARVGLVRARASEFAQSYPAGEHDVVLLVEGAPTAAAVADLTASVFDADPRCRRVVLPVGEEDVPAIAWAEDAGFRYVVDVEVRSGGYSLLVAEPEWVLEQPHVLDDIPLKE